MKKLTCSDEELQRIHKRMTLVRRSFKRNRWKNKNDQREYQKLVEQSEGWGA